MLRQTGQTFLQLAWENSAVSDESIAGMESAQRLLSQTTRMP
jgi:hypothetical protein